jgi:hypothetical protein
MLSISLVTAAALVAAKPDVSVTKQVQINIQIGRGDPKGTVEAGTMRIISMPTVTTKKDRPGYVLSGREVPVVRDGNVEYLQFGIRVQVTPRSIDKRSVEVEVEFEDSSREGSPPLRAAMSGRFARGHAVRLFLPTPPGEPQIWAEIVVESAAR